MKAWLVSLALGLTVAPLAQAQEAAAPRPLRPLNLPNPRGTDSGAGPACEQLTTYGEAQPPGPAAVPYGKGAPPPAPAAALPTFAQATPARADSTLGAAGIDVRGVTIPDAPVLPFKFMPAPQPPQGTAGFANVNGVGLLKDGRLVVNQRLPMYQTLVYSADGRLLRNPDPNLQSRPHGMRIDRDDNIWLTDQQCNTVIKLNVNGDVLLRLGTSGKAGTWDEAKGDKLFNQPTDIAFGPNGDVFVSTGHGGPDPRIVRFDRNGKSGYGTYEFGEAHYMTMSADGRTMYVGDTVNNDIKKLQLN